MSSLEVENSGRLDDLTLKEYRELHPAVRYRRWCVIRVEYEVAAEAFFRDRATPTWVAFYEAPGNVYACGYSRDFPGTGEIEQWEEIIDAPIFVFSRRLLGVQ